MSKSIFEYEQTISHERGSMSLTRVDFAIELCAPLAKTVLTQQFVNHSDEIVEATYHFPVPKSACVSDIVVSINDKRYTSQVAEKSQAQAQYEEGIESGKRAVLVQIQDDGVYELIIGNVAPNDEIEISLTISQLLQSRHTGYQYILPTMVAPKYDSSGSIDRNKGLYQSITEHCFFARYPFTATIHNHLGNLRSVSHALTSNADNESVMSGLLDKNIVLNIDNLPTAPYSLACHPNNANAETSAILTIPPIADSNDTIQDDVTSICLVVDCSGSMAGSSIAQLRDGLLGLISELGDKDEVSLICFGTRTKCHTPRPVKINHHNKEALMELVSSLDASMGGTNIFDALEEAQRQAQKHIHSPQVIVLTDGWISQYERQLGNIAKQSNAPVHTVGIGSGANDDFILALGDALNGEICFVHPNENMVNVVSHFIQSVSAPKTEITWHVPSHTYAKLPQTMAQTYGAVGLLLTNAQGQEKPTQYELNGMTHIFEPIAVPDALSDTLAKVIGSHYIRSLKKDHREDALAMTIKLGIITEDVSCVMVSDEIVEGADGLPSQVNIPQMTPDMMGGMPSYSMHSSASASKSSGGEYLDIPSFLRRMPDESPADSVPKKVAAKVDFTELLKKVDAKLSRRFNMKPPTLKQLEDWSLSKNILDWLHNNQENHPDGYSKACLAVTLLEIDDVYMLLSDKSKGKLYGFISKVFNVTGKEIEKIKSEVQKMLTDLDLSK